MENKKPWYTKAKNTKYVQLNISLYPAGKKALLAEIKKHILYCKPMNAILWLTSKLKISWREAL